MMAQIQHEKDRLNLAPKKFVMWLFVFASFMIFAAFTSGFIVYEGGSGHGLNVILPTVFRYSTASIIVSSITLFLASRAAKRLEFGKQRLLLWVTFALGIIFCVIQLDGWYILTKTGIYFVNPNAARSFIYILTGVHMLHVLGGVIVLLVMFFKAFSTSRKSYSSVAIEVASTYWHFVDLLWIYLLFFLILIR